MTVRFGVVCAALFAVAASTPALAASAANPPPKVTTKVVSEYFATALHFDSYGNLSLPDCGVAAAADVQEVIRRTPPDYLPVMTAVYSLGGQSTGVVPAKIFGYWQTTGIDGYKPVAIEKVAVASTSRSVIKTAIDNHRALWADLEIPSEFNNVWHNEWEFALGNGRLGPLVLHAVAVVGWSSQGVDVITWGTRALVTWPYWAKHGVEMDSVAY